MVGQRYDDARDALASGRQHANGAHVEVAEHGHGDGARDRRGRHHENVRWFGTLQPQGFALVDAEPVLLVDHDEAEVEERDGVAEQGVGTDHDA